MATKTISITDEAYERLLAYKGKNESFSDVVNKLTCKHTLLDLVGILSPGEVNSLKDALKDLHTRLRKDVDDASRSLT